MLLQQKSKTLSVRFWRMTYEGPMGHRCRKSVLEGHIQHEAFGAFADTSTMK